MSENLQTHFESEFIGSESTYIYIYIYRNH